MFEWNGVEILAPGLLTPYPCPRGRRAALSGNGLPDTGWAATILTTATVLGKKPDQRIHLVEIRGIDQLPAQAALDDQSRPLQVLQVKREA